MARRSKARQVVLQMLYEADVNPDVDPIDIRHSIDEQLNDRSLSEFAWSLFSGVIESKDEIDQQIETAAENWTLSRMAPTDRNVLRLGVFEIAHTDTPNPVVIDEAIELAKQFGSKQSSQFVNGILDKFHSAKKQSP